MKSDYISIKNEIGEKIFQFEDGTYLPDSSQPLPINSKRYTPHESIRYINIVGDLGSREALPKLYEHRENCCGCTACYAICPMSGTNRSKTAIRTNENGEPLVFEFLTPGTGGLRLTYEHSGAITMLPDEEGFLYPVIDAGICVRCYKCVSVCAFKDAQLHLPYK